MFFKRFSKTFVLADGTADNFGSINGQAGGSPFKISDRNWWLESIHIGAFVKAGGAQTTYTADGWANLVDKIELSVDEPNFGSRNNVNLKGVSALAMGRNLIGRVDRITNATAVNGTTSNGTVYGVTYPVLFRIPPISEPISTFTCLPLHRYGSDPLLKVTLGNKTDIAGTTSLDATWKGVKLVVRLGFVEVIDSGNKFPHIRTLQESKANYAWGGSGQRTIEDITQGGILLGMLQEDYVGSTPARTYCVADPYADTYTLEYRGRNVRQETPVHLQGANDLSQDNAAGYTAPASIFWDTLSELTMSDTGGFRSTFDLSPAAMQGGKLRLIGSNITSSSTPVSRLSYIKMLDEAERVYALPG